MQYNDITDKGTLTCKDTVFDLGINTKFPRRTCG